MVLIHAATNSLNIKDIIVLAHAKDFWFALV